MAEKSCCIESCDMFDFMSDYVGRNVLHPGGKKATDALFEMLHLDKGKTVLDVACGKGLTSVAIAKRYGCKVIGVDISEKSIDKAKAFARKARVNNVTFEVANAKKLPFSDNQCDGGPGHADSGGR
jgi:arsenite methyltransferase